jgi:hypothetical protein
MFYHKCAAAAVGCLLLAAPAWAAEVTEYKGAKLVRFEERGVLVFKLPDKDVEIKAPPSLNMKGFDKDGKALPTGIPLKKDDLWSKQVLKIGNVLDIKINQVNSKSAILIEARLVSGELLKPGAVSQERTGSATNKSSEEKAKAAEDARAKVEQGRAKAAEQREKLAAATKIYASAKVRSYDEKKKLLTFEADGRQHANVQVSGTVKALDREGSELRKEDRFGVFNQGNVLHITTMKPTGKEFVTGVRLLEGTLASQ